MSRKKARQLEIVYRTHGGRRRGAGRKPIGERAGVSHSRRRLLTGREPVLVTLKVRKHVWSLRARRAFERLLPTFFAARERMGMRLVHFSVQGDHVHLIVEVADRASLSRGVKGLCVRMARALNRMMGRTGSVFADRYHDRVLETPRQVRTALAYVRCNARKHGVKLRAAELDPCSSAAAFADWSGRVIVGALGRLAARVVVPPASWLLARGWKKSGSALDPDHAPGTLPH